MIIRGATFKSYLKPIAKPQNRALRIISNAQWAEKVTPLFHDNNILKFDDMINFEIAKFMLDFVKISCQLILMITFAKPRKCIPGLPAQLKNN